MSDSSWSRVANYLPTGTSLAFQAVANAIVSPTVKGSCHVAEKTLAGIALGALGAVCVFSAYTDTITYKGKTYYLLLRCGANRVPIFLNGYPEDYNGQGQMPAELEDALSHVTPIDWHDILHSILSLLVFLTLALLNDPVRSCFFGTDVPASIVQAVPVMVTVFASAFFSKFLKEPRKNIGFNFSGGSATAQVKRVSLADNSRLTGFNDPKHNLL
eukprot:TRINITY_DN238_c0_g1_i1.p1 TRINITY_DN238_c0_g1~~TRINITY_DN238_c0_g1_i1.p1  ORF type:complete len:215 (-),score=63.39 TRINITY_DN238_c0_g1_i1:39-683(-)